MQKNASSQRAGRVLAVSVMFLTAFNVLIWRTVATYELTPPLGGASIAVAGYAEMPEAVHAPIAQEIVGEPVRISIPSIAVDAAIEKVALAKDGSMDVPEHPDDTGWYALGPRPGEQGSAAIAGHVDRKDGGAAVFTDLHKVRSGDRIAVQDDKGAVVAFAVREVRRYDADADASDVFTSNDGKAHLNVITCVGAWDARANRYAERLVVFADKVAE